MQRRRACRKPGATVPYRSDVAVYRCSSPALAGTRDGTLYECPVGYVLRHAPWAYDVLAASVYAESAGLTVLQQSAFLQSALRLVGAEKGRHAEQERKIRKAKQDADHGAKILKRG